MLEKSCCEVSFPFPSNPGARNSAKVLFINFFPILSRSYCVSRDNLGEKQTSLEISCPPPLPPYLIRSWKLVTKVHHSRHQSHQSTPLCSRTSLCPVSLLIVDTETDDNLVGRQSSPPCPRCLHFSPPKVIWRSQIYHDLTIFRRDYFCTDNLIGMKLFTKVGPPKCYRVNSSVLKRRLKDHCLLRRARFLCAKSNGSMGGFHQ